MKFVALLSGGKDSCYNAVQCVRNGHELVCLANLYPPAATSDEADSFMYQSAAHTAIDAQAECFGKPLVRRELSGRAVNQALQYVPTADDEVEDLMMLLTQVKEQFPEVEGVASGAILSNYQRTRVENVCGRLGLQSLAFLWRKRQSPLLKEMVEAGVDAVVVKVASFGLEPSKHLGKSIQALRPFFEKLHSQCGFHVCGEGGEYETLTLDCPLFVRRLVLDETMMISHSDDMFAPVGLLRIVKCHTEPKVQHTSPFDGTVNGSIAEDGAEAAREGLKRKEEDRRESRGELPPIISSVEGDRTTEWTDGAPPRKAKFLPHVKETSGGLLYLSGVRAPGPIPHRSSRDTAATGAAAAAASAAEQVKCCLSAAFAALQGAGVSTMKDVCFVHLYLRDMGHFAAVNTEYCTWFEGENPPSRSCVSVTLPAGCSVMLDLIAVRGSGQALAREGAACSQRQVLHVRSLSNWAPVCIGPYCQASSLGPGNALALIAGQIGLIPASMVLPCRRYSAGSIVTSIPENSQQARPSFHGAELALCVRHASAVASAVGASLSRGCLFATLYVSEETAAAAAAAVAAAADGVRASHTSRSSGDWRDALVEECRSLIEEGFAEEQAEALAAAEEKGVLGDDESAEEGWNSDPEELAQDAARKRVAARDIPILPVIVPMLPKNAAVELEVLCMSRRALSLLPCLSYARPTPPASAAQLGNSSCLRGRIPPTTGAGTDTTLPIPPHLLPQHTTRYQQACASPNVDVPSWPTELNTGNLSFSVACTGSTVDRVLCIAESSLTINAMAERASTTSANGLKSSAPGLRSKATGSLERTTEGSDSDPVAEVVGTISVSGAQLEEALLMVFDSLAGAISAARLKWRDVASLRVYFLHHQSHPKDDPIPAGTADEDARKMAGLGWDNHREGLEQQEELLRRAVFLALAGTTRERPAVTFVPITGMGNGARVSIHATALSLDRLKTELWIREAA